MSEDIQLDAPEMVKPVKVMVARFPYGAQEHPDICDWVTTTVCTMKEDARIGEILRFRIDDTPITMGRNRALKAARENNVDFLLMLDSDMSPDRYLGTNPYNYCNLPDAKPFWDSSFDFLWEQRYQKGEPSVIAAPYCGPPPVENVYVFRWQTLGSDVPADESNLSLEQYDRWTAYHETGIKEVAALPTGLFLMDMRAMKDMVPPYTYYEFTDGEETEKASTEDVTFTRDMALMGIPQFCNWDAWAGHWKMKCVGKPHIIGTTQVGKKYENAMKRKFNLEQEERVVNVIPPKDSSVPSNGHSEGCPKGAAGLQI